MPHMIKTSLTARELMKLNPSIKSMKDAEKILHTIKTEPAVSLEELIGHKHIMVTA